MRAAYFKKEKMKKEISFSVTIEEYETIKAYAQAAERSLSNLAKYALKTHMKRYSIVGINKENNTQ